MTTTPKPRKGHAMTRDDIIRMAVEAGATYYEDSGDLLVDDLDPFDFAELVAAAVRKEGVKEQLQ